MWKPSQNCCMCFCFCKNDTKIFGQKWCLKWFDLNEMKYSRFFWRSFPGKFGEICAKFLRTLKNLPAPTPMAEEALSGSTDVGLFVSTAWYSFSRLFDLFFVASKRLISFITIFDRVSSCAGIVLWSSLSRITWIMCFHF